MRARLAPALALALAAATLAGAEGDKAGRPPPPPVARPFPPDNPWNQDVSRLPVHARSDAYIRSIGADGKLHADFGTTWQGAPNGIPYVVVRKGQLRAPVAFTESADESDPGPYPIPPDAPIEGGPEGKGDRHVIAVDIDARRLYELFDARPDGKGDLATTSRVKGSDFEAVETGKIVTE